MGKDKRHRRMMVVTISWPGDNDRGSETYGPFDDEAARDEWVTACEETADMGRNRLLVGAHYLLHRIDAPFDPWSVSGDAARMVFE